MADGEDELSGGGMFLAVIAGLTAIVTIIVTIASPGVSYGGGAAVFVWAVLVAWIAPRHPGAGFALGLGGGLGVMAVIYFATTFSFGDMFLTECRGDCEAEREARGLAGRSHLTVMVVSMGAQAIVGSIWGLILLAFSLSQPRQPLEPLPDHNEAQRELPEARVVRDRRVE